MQLTLWRTQKANIRVQNISILQTAHLLKNTESRENVRIWNINQIEESHLLKDPKKQDKCLGIKHE